MTPSHPAQNNEALHQARENLRQLVSEGPMKMNQAISKLYVKQPTAKAAVKAAGGANLWLQSIGYKFTELDRVDYAKHLLGGRPGLSLATAFGQAAKPSAAAGAAAAAAAPPQAPAPAAAPPPHLAAVLREQQERGAAAATRCRRASFARGGGARAAARGCRRRLEASRAPCRESTGRRARRRPPPPTAALAAAAAAPWRFDGAQLVVREGITGVVFAAEQGIFAEYLARRLFGVPASQMRALEAIHRARDTIVLFVINTTRAEMHGVFSTAAPPGYRLHASAFPRSAGSEPLVAQMPVGRCGPALAPLAEASFGDVLGAGWQRALEPEGAALPRPRDGTVLGAGRADASAWTLDTPKVQLLLSRLPWSSRTRRRDGAPSRRAAPSPRRQSPSRWASPACAPRRSSRRLRSARRRLRRRPASTRRRGRRRCRRRWRRR